ncbi:uncharacterized protein J4E79_011673 [Alternaria viburni]|uniref:uncharacterized protein n=1 Tax=Alternaria viburni TaxID=566460 RepID=UPI0020C4A06A|nr:uncharacterized protein J4E79_011673 [Alternaria viburni]KAI4641466.1 hypothetical protein J4E79_011673 [Alternaria viburni]
MSITPHMDLSDQLHPMDLIQNILWTSSRSGAPHTRITLRFVTPRIILHSLIADADESVVWKGYSSVAAPAGQLHGDAAPQTADYKILRKNPPKEAENFEQAEDFDDSDDSDDSDDPCKLYKSLPAGFPRLAEFMASKPERALFRTFKTLGVQNLHYMQAELDYLEWKLGLSMEMEQNSGLTAKLATDWGFSIMKSPACASEQYHIIMEIRQKLEKYGTVESPTEEALLRQRKLNKISPPDHFDLEQVQAYNVSKAVEDGLIHHYKPMFGDSDDETKTATDLIPLASREYSDLFTFWVCEQSLTILRIFQRFLPKDKVSGKAIINDCYLSYFTYYFTAVIASLVPAVVAHLSQQERDIAQFMVMTSTNLLVSGCMTYFTGTERSDLFVVSVLFSIFQLLLFSKQ